MKNICYIIGASVTEGMYIDRQAGDFVIAADRGLEALSKLGISADLCVGDFDSLGRVPDFENTLQHPCEKDDTDTALALCEGIKRGYTDFVIYGGLGGRLDHTMANIQNCAGAADHGSMLWMWGEGNAVCIFGDENSLSFGADMKGMISVFASDRACGVNIEGLKYTLKDACLTSMVPLGVSNEFVGNPVNISAQDGVLIVMWNEDAESFVEKIR